MQATRQSLSEGRWHFQHGPIDIVLELHGDASACHQALERTWLRFQTVLPELVSELPLLRQTVSQLHATSLKGVVAQRMWQASHGLSWAAQDGFVTPMAAVAGSVAQALIPSLIQVGVDKAYVNNGGDIALHLQENQSWRIGVVSDLQMADFTRNPLLNPNSTHPRNVDEVGYWTMDAKHHWLKLPPAKITAPINMP
jgi:ApbE superfamily uncharacterized protein (UPF0280 family)